MQSTPRWLVIPALLLCTTVFAAPLTLKGLSEAEQRNVLAFLALDDEPCDAPAWRVKRRFDTLEKPVGEALAAYGYYEIQIEKTLAFADNCWSAEVTVQPGQRVRFRNIDIAITGAATNDSGFRALAPDTMVTGAPLIHSVYDAYKDRLRMAAAERGYADAQFLSAALDIFVAEYAADVSIAFESGDRYQFGEFRLDQSVLDEALVRRYMRVNQGQQFSRTALTRLQRDLSATGYFDQVRVSADYEGALDRQIPIDVFLTPSDKLGYFFGVGASTDRGPRVRGGYTNRRVNTRGHQFNSDVQLSPVLSRIDATYRKPLANPLREWQQYSLRLENENTDTTRSDGIDVGVQRTRALANDWLLNWGAQAALTQYRVAEVKDTSYLLMPVVGISRRVADEETNPRNGYSLHVRTRAASRTLLSSTDFIQIYANARYLRGIGSKGRLSLRVEAGTTMQREFDELPPQIRFFAGGDSSVRGYSYRSLGPQDANGDVIGGNSLLAGSIEYEHSIGESWGVATFIDAGNAFDDFDVSLRTGVGFGVVWRSPVGPMRMYLAHPLNDDATVRLHLSFGADL